MNEELYQKLLNSGFRFVSYRPRSEKEIRSFLAQKLKRRKVNGKDELEQAIARLGELGYIDDAKFAQWWVDERATHRPKGRRVVLMELRAKGIPKEILEETIGFPPETELAKKALAKKLKLFAKLPALERKKKIYGFLGRRGFSGETIARVIDEMTPSGVQ